MRFFGYWEIVEKLKKYDLTIVLNHKIKDGVTDLAEYDMLAFDNKTNNLSANSTTKEEVDDEWYLKVDDENLIRNFAESMINNLPEDGSVIVYNKSFEASRNKELGEMYPDLKEEMERINGNIVDLMIPFRNRDYYKKEMEGSYSIKYVLPALYPDDPELDYINLPLIHNGGEASEAFLSLKDKTLDEQEEIREGLLEYCKLDTYAMVKIWEKFKEVIK